MAATAGVTPRLLSSLHDGQLNRVLYVEKSCAKALKTALESAELIDPDRRMRPATRDDFSLAVGGKTATWDSCVCIPVSERCAMIFEEWRLNPSSHRRYAKNEKDWTTLVVASGVQSCPASVSVIASVRQGGFGAKGRRRRSKGSDLNMKLTPIQEGVVKMLERHLSSPAATSRDKIEREVARLSPTLCPNKLERLGDDRSLVIPQNAFQLDSTDFGSLIERYCQDPVECLRYLWRLLADIHSSPRVVRRGDINPDSKVRESGHRLLYPNDYDAIAPGIPATTGPGTPGWICCTENTIKQYFDMTRVMFSRGNVTEKLRFGEVCVAHGDIVLDMFAGIGYYTLPALCLGNAAHVYSCEWNPNAVAALNFNLKENKVEDRVTILEGDSRITVPNAGIVGCIDRVSLGLLPSSEGAWKTAIQSLKRSRGGWIHVHGNVPVAEKKKWAMWLSRRLADLAEDDGRHEWIALCSHIERVKSFAPKIDHFVADIFVGPANSGLIKDKIDSIDASGILHDGVVFEPCQAHIDPPSCALNRDGVLCQQWMM